MIDHGRDFTYIDFFTKLAIGLDVDFKDYIQPIQLLLSSFALSLRPVAAEAMV